MAVEFQYLFFLNSSGTVWITALINQAGQGSGVTLSAKDVQLQVGRMLANDKAFQLEAIFEATVDARLGQIAFP